VHEDGVGDNSGFDSEAIMTAEKIEAFRLQLQELWRRLRGDIAVLEAQVGVPTVGHDGGNLSIGPLHLADLSTAIYMHKPDATLRENREYLQQEVLKALERVDQGSYGLCQRCGGVILEARLELLPYAAFCTRCAADVQAGKSVNPNLGQPLRTEEMLSSDDERHTEEPEHVRPIGPGFDMQVRSFAPQSGRDDARTGA
jgi:RNA polymerase-binding transcription factor DksA